MKSIIPSYLIIFPFHFLLMSSNYQ